MPIPEPYIPHTRNEFRCTEIIPGYGHMVHLFENRLAFTTWRKRSENRTKQIVPYVGNPPSISLGRCRGQEDHRCEYDLLDPDVEPDRFNRELP